MNLSDPRRLHHNSVAGSGLRITAGAWCVGDADFSHFIKSLQGKPIAPRTSPLLLLHMAGELITQSIAPPTRDRARLPATLQESPERLGFKGVRQESP